MTDARGDTKQARKTALVVGAMLVALAAFSLWRLHPLRAQVLGAAGALLLLIGLVAPSWARPFHRGWMTLAAGLGYVNSRIILGVMYYGVMTPIAFVMRLAGRDPLRRRGRAAGSYWIPRPKTRQNAAQFERLF